MHIALVSACEKKALPRTRAVLDSYAVRSGDRTWLTPITSEGLAELRAMLRRTATRQTSVACFRNDGRGKMVLLWIVGAKVNFDRNGASPVATRLRRNGSLLPEWARVCALVAGTAGLVHDLGKYGDAFQQKLQNLTPTADPVRHEWISLMLARELLQGTSWEEAWKRISGGGKTRRYENIDPFDRNLSSAREALLYLVATHHKLPREDGLNVMSAANHVRDKSHEPRAEHAPPLPLMERILRKLNKVKECGPRDDHLYWRAAATISRMALILADHSVSAKKLFHDDGAAYANTCRQREANGKQILIPNQNLDWHLDEVGKVASSMVFNMLSLAPPVLSRDTVERICKPSEGRFAWQNSAARALTDSAEQDNTPHLVFNMASTGSGKTRMNCRAVCVLRNGDSVRVATTLNLRTLTLQTADAYTTQLGIGKDELACVIGDRVTSKLYEYQKNADKKEVFVDDDENPALHEIEAIGEFEYYEKPGWLDDFTDRKPSLCTIIGAPILVSTIDFLIAAGDPRLQAHHALAALRVMSSDLILDEIDGYDPKPLLSVLRLVTMAAMFGRNVIASSATLSRPVAQLLWQAYAKGAEMRGRPMGGGSFKTAVIDDMIEPQVEELPNVAEFMKAYEKRVTLQQKALSESKPRAVPYLQDIQTKTVSGWKAAACDAITKLHTNNSWIDPRSGKKLSFGLVRMANIKPAIEMASHLADRFPQAKVACYHANHLRIQRWHIEQRLDHLLTRSGGADHILADNEIRGILCSTPHCEVMFVVVATPVEEIGRDHDFDWAVIEPSSAQSIVQTAGRVNRHRLLNIDKPNIAIMRYNLREVKGEKLVFRWPGLETLSDCPYESHDLSDLLDWNELGQIDARVRFGGHKLAHTDDKSIEDITRNIFARMMSDDTKSNLWMSADTYTKSLLRDDGGRVRLDLTLNSPYDDPASFLVKEEGASWEGVQRKVDILNSVSNAWLSLVDEELTNLASDILGPDNIESALNISVFSPRANHRIVRHLNFGLYCSSP